MKYRIYRWYETYTVEQSRLGIFWRPALYRKDGIPVKTSIEEAQEDLKLLKESGPVKNGTKENKLMDSDCTENQKNISRRIIVFKKSGSQFFIYIQVQGYQTLPENPKEPLFSEAIPLGYCTDKEITKQIEIFSRANYNIEVVEQ